MDFVIFLQIVLFLYGVLLGWVIAKTVFRGRRPFCYCRGDDPGHACLKRCYDSQRLGHGRIA